MHCLSHNADVGPERTRSTHRGIASQEASSEMMLYVSGYRRRGGTGRTMGQAWPGSSALPRIAFGW